MEYEEIIERRDCSTGEVNNDSESKEIEKDLKQRKMKNIEFARDFFYPVLNEMENYIITNNDGADDKE